MDVMASEVWIPALGYEGKYEVSDAGRVRSVDRYTTTRGKPFWRKGRVLKQSINRDGYAYVGIGRSSTAKLRLVHHVVLESFVGLRAKKQQCCHINGKRDDNRLANLKWGSASENQQHKVLHGTDSRGERSGMAKLTEECVKRALDMRACGVPGRAIGRWFGVHPDYMNTLLAKGRWGSLHWST
jgi:hypothetical protein